MKPGYESTTVGQAVAHLAEELCEAGCAAAKSLRWGIRSYNPELPVEEQETNIAWLRREIQDVVMAYVALGDLLHAQENFKAGILVDDIAEALERATE